MEQTSKTLTVALSELLDGLKYGKSVTITNLAYQLACDLVHAYEPYRPYKKKLRVKVILQEDTRIQSMRLYSAICEIIEQDSA